MTHPIVRFGVPFLAGAAVSAGTIIGTMLVRDRAEQPSLSAPQQPLAFHGWWDSGESSPLAYAHPAVLFVDASNGTIVDSWDRRTRARVSSPTVQWSPDWPSGSIVVVDAETGDLLQALRGVHH